VTRGPSRHLHLYYRRIDRQSSCLRMRSLEASLGLALRIPTVRVRGPKVSSSLSGPIAFHCGWLSESSVPVGIRVAPAGSAR